MRRGNGVLVSRYTGRMGATTAPHEAPDNSQNLRLELYEGRLFFMDARARSATSRGTPGPGMGTAIHSELGFCIVLNLLR